MVGLGVLSNSRKVETSVKSWKKPPGFALFSDRVPERGFFSALHPAWRCIFQRYGWSLHSGNDYVCTCTIFVNDTLSKISRVHDTYIQTLHPQPIIPSTHILQDSPTPLDNPSPNPAGPFSSLFLLLLLL